MTASEFDNELGDRLNAQPFHPFAVVLKTGKVIEIDDRRRVAFRNGHAVKAESKRVWIEFDAEDVQTFTATSSQVSTSA